MTTHVLLLLSTLLMPQEISGTAAPPGFGPDEILTPPRGPETAIIRSVPPEVVSLRLSVPLVESPQEAGAGQLIQIQAQRRMEVIAARIGARAEVHRTPQALVYEISGASADLDFLAWILREGLQRPTPGEFAPARRELQTELDRRVETPQGVLYTRVRAILAPDAPSVTGTAGALDRMDASRLDAFWARTHRRDNFRLVVAARLPTELILSALSGVGLDDRSPAPEVAAGEQTGSPLPAPEIIRHWVVQAYRLGPGPDATDLIVAGWLGEVLRADGGDFEAGVEIWDLGTSRALVISGAAYPRSRQAMQGRVASVIGDAAARLTESDVRRLADELRTEVHMAARTPWGLAELIGQAWDSGHGPEGVEVLLDELSSVNYTRVLERIQSLAEATPVREELHP
jgi:hypothetical protein